MTCPCCLGWAAGRTLKEQELERHYHRGSSRTPGTLTSTLPHAWVASVGWEDVQRRRGRELQWAGGWVTGGEPLPWRSRLSRCKRRVGRNLADPGVVGREKQPSPLG